MQGVDSLQLALCHREFKYIGVVNLLKIFTLPLSSGVLTHNLGLRESDVVQLPFSGHLCDVAQINLDGAALVHVTDSEVELIHSFSILAWLLGQ